MGEWKKDCREGHGILSVLKSDNHPTDKNLKLYIGNWKNDKKDGLGTFHYSDRSRYEGQWSKDYREGWGKMAYEDGTIYEGAWVKGKRHGEGTYLLGSLKLIKRMGINMRECGIKIRRKDLESTLTCPSVRFIQVNGI